MTSSPPPPPDEPDADRRAVAPPFRPDPAIISNAEGNKRVLKSDRQGAQKILDDLVASDPPEPGSGAGPKTRP
ncbi:MAG: hypothetical protein ACRDP1_16005 [Nocardioidaceae bacterium]